MSAVSRFLTEAMLLGKDCIHQLVAQTTLNSVPVDRELHIGYCNCADLQYYAELAVLSGNWQYTLILDIDYIKYI